MNNLSGKTSENRQSQQNNNSNFMSSVANSRSNTKFIIRYDEKQITAVRSQSKNNRYSQKHEYNQLRYKKISESTLQKNKLKLKDGHIPSYLRPTQSSISAKLQRYRIVSMADINNQNKTASIAKVRSKSLQEEENQNQKQYNKIPIQFYDEKNYGCGADSLRARVIYRGYAPKNTYYYLKTLKPFKRRPKKLKQNPLSTCSISDETNAQKPITNLTSQVSSISSIPSVNLAKNNNEFDLRFESKFESGNLSAVSRISTYQYWLYMRQDTNTHGLRQWYYFVIVNRKPVKVKFRIYKFTKSYSLYRVGMKPYIRTCINNIQRQWQQGGQKVKYQYDNAQKCYFVEFEYKFQQQNQEVEFAMLPPYTYSMLKQYLRSLQNIEPKQSEKFFSTNPQQQISKISNTQDIYTSRQQASLIYSKQQRKKIANQQQGQNDNQNQKQNQKQVRNHHKITMKQYKSVQNFVQQPNSKDTNNHNRKIKVQIRTLGQSLAGLDIPSIQITKLYTTKQQQMVKNRQAIIVLSRTHPGQTVSNYSVQSFVDTIIKNEQIVEYYDFYIIPMVNPDGVYFGNHRTSVIGQDLNRNFHNNDYQLFPQIQIVHSLILKVRRTHRIRYLIDLHGHSARKNIFAYGDEHQINSNAYLLTRILPKLLNDEISSFKYNYCIFKESKQKKNTARVHFSNRYKINCITIEQSYGVLDEGAIGIRVWRNFGMALANCLLQFARIYNEGKEKALEQYLKDEISREREQLQKIIIKHKKMLGIVDKQIVSQDTSNDTHMKQMTNKNNKDTMNREVIHQNVLEEKVQGQNQRDAQQFQSTQNEKNIKQGQMQQQSRQQLQQQQQKVNQNQQDCQMKKEDPQEQEQEQSVSLSQLSSGDEQLQLKVQEIQVIKKDIYKVGCMKEGFKRQIYNIADKKLQLYECDYSGDYTCIINNNNGQFTSNYKSKEELTHRRLHEQKSSMIPRIAKLQLKRKEDYNMSFKVQFRENNRDLLEKQRIERRKEIQAKFKKMELPSIRK